ncbi:MAG: hypothetical protein ACYCQI_04390 [Gammaproteobacteria bacterium]
MALDRIQLSSSIAQCHRLYRCISSGNINEIKKIPTRIVKQMFLHPDNWYFNHEVGSDQLHATTLIAKHVPEAFLYFIATFPKVFKKRKVAHLAIGMLIAYGRYDLAKELVNQGVHPDHAFYLLDWKESLEKDTLGRNKIINQSIETLEKQQVDFLKFLISKGLNVNQPYPSFLAINSIVIETCPLIDAAEDLSNPTCCKLLLEAKADPLLPLVSANINSRLPQETTPLLELVKHDRSSNFAHIKLMFDKLRERDPNFMLNNSDISHMGILSEYSAPPIDLEIYLLTHYVDLHNPTLNIISIFQRIVREDIPEEKVLQLALLFIQNHVDLTPALKRCHEWLKNHNIPQASLMTRSYDFFCSIYDFHAKSRIMDRILVQRMNHFIHFCETQICKNVAHTKSILKDHGFISPGPATLITDYVFKNLQ